jgi:hypothetical protein
MKFLKNIIYLLLVASLPVMQSCVKDEANIFDDTAAARGQKAVEACRALLTSAENGWYVNYYPELNHSVGGYAMYWKFTADGQVKVQCETATNNPPNTPDVSEFDIFMEQGTILSFSSYNKVLHYFCESVPSDYNGQEGDYEFIVMNVEPDQILLKGKKHGNKMTLRRNVANLDPDTYLAEVVALANNAADALALHLIVANDTIGTAEINRRTFLFKYTDATDPAAAEIISYTFTGDGLRLYEPVTIKGVTMENFRWDNDLLRYVCTDPGVNVYWAAFFPPDFQLRYGEFLGKWSLEYTARIGAAWEATRRKDTVEIVQLEQNATFRMACAKMFNFEGLVLTFNRLKGSMSFYPMAAIANVVDGGNYDLWQILLASNRSNAYGTLGGPGGLVGIWNQDAAGERKITFEDNGAWVTYKAASIILRCYTGTTYAKNYSSNVDNKIVFENLVLTKINE